MSGSRDYYNAEGYADPTAYQAEKNVERERADARKDSLIADIKQRISAAGFVLLNRIQLKDKETGKIYR